MLIVWHAIKQQTPMNLWISAQPSACHLISWFCSLIRAKATVQKCGIEMVNVLAKSIFEMLIKCGSHHWNWLIIFERRACVCVSGHQTITFEWTRWTKYAQLYRRIRTQKPITSTFKSSNINSIDSIDSRNNNTAQQEQEQESHRIEWKTRCRNLIWMNECLRCFDGLLLWLLWKCFTEALALILWVRRASVLCARAGERENERQMLHVIHFE